MPSSSDGEHSDSLTESMHAGVWEALHRMPYETGSVNEVQVVARIIKLFMLHYPCSKCKKHMESLNASASATNLCMLPHFSRFEKNNLQVRCSFKNKRRKKSLCVQHTCNANTILSIVANNLM